MDQSVNANVSLPMPQSTSGNGGQLSVKQRRRAVKAAKANKELENVAEATRKLAINDEPNIHDQNKHYPQRSDVSQSEWDLIEKGHDARTKAERSLFANTKLLPHMGGIGDNADDMLTFNRLFGKIVPLLENPQDRAKDEDERRNGVAILMRAREAAGFEPINEAAKWAHIGLGLTKQLETKVKSKSFRDIEERYADRKAHRRFLEANIEFFDQIDCGISKQRKHWLRTNINDLVCPPDDAKAKENLQKTSIQVVYWVIVYRDEAGFPLELTHSCPCARTIAMHQWLKKQPLSYFEQDDFELEEYFDIDLAEIKKLAIREMQQSEDKFWKEIEIDADEIAQMDAELDALVSDDEPMMAMPPTATGLGQISAHSYVLPALDQGARKRHHSSSPEYLYPEPLTPARSTKRRRG